MSYPLAHKGFSIIWVGLLILITWLDTTGLFVYLPYGICALLVLVIGITPLIWQADYLRLRWGILMLGTVWLLVLPSIPWNTDKAFLLNVAKIRSGMTTEQVRTVMTGYTVSMRNSVTSTTGQSYDFELIFYADAAADTTAVVVDFQSDQVAQVRIDLD